jgi:dethiobiotin synthetase
MPIRGVFVTGTDTGVGKSVLAGAVVARLRADGVDVRALKPVITGLDDPADPNWPPDHVLLARAAGCRPEQVVVTTYGPPVSPHFAAELTARPIDPDAIIGAARSLAADGEVLVVEGVGGLLVPVADGYDVRRLAAELGLPLLVAARPGLGTINHTLLTLEAARAVGLTVAAVVLTPWPEQPNAMQTSNRETIERLGEVEVWTLPEIASADPAALAAAGAQLRLAAVPSLAWSAAVL